MLYHCFLLALCLNVVLCSDEQRLLDVLRDISLEDLDNWIDEKGKSLECHSCSGKNCPGTGTCKSAVGKCFVRQDPNGIKYWGCPTHDWPNTKPFIGCKNLKQGGWTVNGKFKPVKWCLCDSDFCNKDINDNPVSIISETSNVEYPSLTGAQLKQLKANLYSDLTWAVNETNVFFVKHEEDKIKFYDKGVDRKYTHGAKALHLAFLKTKPAASEIARIGCMVDDTTHRLSTKLKLDANHCVAIPGLAVPVPFHCPFKEKICCDDKDKFRTADGKCNNLKNPLWGAAFTPFRRFIVPAYGDFVNSPRSKGRNNQNLPNARLVSTTVHKHPTSMDVDDRYTHMLMQWGQFLDHDIDAAAISKGYSGADLTCCEDNLQSKGSKKEFKQIDLDNRSECFPIKIPPNDPHFKTECMDFARSAEAPNTQCTLGYREQLNQITSHIDASNVYGSSKEEQEKLRGDFGGKLKTSDPLWPPKDEKNEGSCTLPDNQPEVKCIIAGDERANEQAGLTTMHTVWFRKHNQIAGELAKLNPHWNDDRLFQVSRKIVGSLMQHITYREFLPLLFGKDGIKTYNLKVRRSGYFKGYNKGIDASIRNSFATAAYRMGHSLINSFLSRLNHKYEVGSHTSARFRDIFFAPASLYDTSEGGIDSYARGLVFDKASKRDALLSEELTNHLFEDSVTKIGLDLAALNLQRGRDHGLPSYNVFRRWCKGYYKIGGTRRYLDKVTSFDELKDTHDEQVRESLKKVYNHVDDIDLFTGAVSEKSVTQAVLGPTLSCILGRQFQLLRVGDRFWYETNDKYVRHTRRQLQAIRKVTLSRILCDTIDTMTDIQEWAFVLPTKYGKNRRKDCKKLKRLELKWWKEKIVKGRGNEQDTFSYEENE